MFRLSQWLRALLPLAAVLLLGGEVDVAAVELLGTAGEARLLRGRSEASAPDTTAWRQREFDDAAWESARGPVFCGKPLTGTDLADLRGQYTCVYLRRAFAVTNAAEILLLRLGTVCDAGFIAWLNGQEIARANVPEGELPFDAVARTQPPQPIPFTTLEIEPWPGGLVAGTNVLAVQAFSSSRGNAAEFLFDASLEADLDDAPPVVATIIPSVDRPLRELNFIEIQFNEPVLGVDATDLLVHGAAATNVVEVAPGDFLFSFTQPADGVVPVAWRPDHGITDRVGASHPFAGGEWSYTLDSAGPAPGVTLTEFMADNKHTLNDEDGDSPDWIEIFNAESTPASLAGWFLTDSRSALAKWRFPEIEVPARGFLLVFASGKNRVSETSRLHTSFKLATEGGYLALVDPATNIVSDFAPTYPQQFTDVAYGRASGETHALGYFTKPTPGAENVSSGPGFGPEIQFSRTGGAFTNAFALALSSSRSNAVIRYTLDGNLPTGTSPTYRDPLVIATSVQVRARAFADGLLPGPPRSEAFLLLHTNVLGFASDLPVLVLHSLGKGAPSSGRLNFAQLSVLEPVNGRTSLTNPPALNLRSGIQIRGSSTEAIAKSSYKLELWNEFGLDAKESLLGLPTESDWVLYAPNNFEPVLIHNPFIHQLSRDLGRYSSRTRFVEVYFNKGSGAITSAHYQGIYVLEEKIKISKDRVAIDELQPENTTPPSVTGGYLLKIDRLDPGDSGLSAGGATVAHVDPKERELKTVQRRPQQTYLRDYFTQFGKALTATNWLDPKLGYRGYVDVNAWIDFHVLEVLSGNVDALVLSTYFHKPRAGKIVFGPHWDFDRALGSTDGRDANPRVWATGPFFSAAWWSRVFADKDFWQAWVDRWQELRATHFALTNVHGLIDRLAGEVRLAQPREYQKWRITLRGGTYQSEVNLMKNWLSNRMDFIDRQLTQPPRLSHAGGAVSPGFQLNLTGPTGATIYYTLDGTDPRASQGGIAPQALVYSQPIRVEANARVVARARDVTKRQSGGPPANSSTPWSGPIAATFVVHTPPLLVTEIMFHPEPPPPGSPYTASDLEFLELKNVGTTPWLLPGFRLTNGVDFVFAATSAVTRLVPGERVLVVANRTAFLSRYPNATNIAGEFAGSLRNSGNRLTLLGPLAEPISDFAYADNWAVLADGFGFSLVLADEQTAPADLGQASRWRLSAGVGGSPGQADPVPQALPPVRVNEVLSNTDPPEQDTIELANPTWQPADVAGWFVTDDFRTPRKYRIADGTVIPPHGLLVLTEADFGGAGAGAFGLSAVGDAVYVFSANAAGELTGYYHGFAFGAVDPGVSLGLHETSDHRQRFVEQNEPTPGRPNRGTRVGPIVISEILYAPGSSSTGGPAEEFVELHNSSLLPVPLFDVARPTNTWRLRGAVSLDFPPNLILPPDGCLVAVGFHPGQELGRLEAFREQYHVKGEVLLVGPWAGRLNNAGETLRLLRPAQPSHHAAATDPLPYALVEVVGYSPTSPWPTNAAGTGRSIARAFETVYADDPQNWFSSRPGPGWIDTDGDGLPDAWELAVGLSPYWPSGDDGAEGDPDGNGVTNLQAYWNDQSPWFGPTRLDCAVLPGFPGWLKVSFPSAPGRRYTLLSREAAAAAAWERHLPLAPATEPQETVLLFQGTTGARWFRLQVE